MGLKDRLDHDILGDFVRARLDHDDLLRGRSHGQVQIGHRTLLGVRVHDELAVDQADPAAADGAVKRNVGDRHGDRGTDHRGDLGGIVLVHAENEVVQQNVVPVILREQRAHRTVDDTARQHGMLRGTALSSEETAGDLSDCVHLLFVIHAQREEIDPFAGLRRRGGGGKDYGVTVVHERGAAGLRGNAADLDLQGTAGQLHGISFKHRYLLW